MQSCDSAGLFSSHSHMISMGRTHRDQKEATSAATATVKTMMMAMMMMMMMVGSSYADVNQDRQQCVGPLSGMATCLTYVGGQAKAPTMDCCNGLKQILKTNKKCLCLLVKDRNDPSINLKFNATLALALPQTCHSSDSITVPQCLELLHLSPNSSDAKAFADFTQGAAPTTTANPPSTGSSMTSEKPKNDGGNSRNPLLGAPAVMFCGALLALSIF